MEPATDVTGMCAYQTAARLLGVTGAHSKNDHPHERLGGTLSKGDWLLIKPVINRCLYFGLMYFSSYKRLLFLDIFSMW